MQQPGRKFSSANGYRYGFNGQEKDNENAGDGNSYTALFWEYDTRIARRWNTDPKQNIDESPYACFSGNPIFLSDRLGDVASGPGPKGLESTEAKDYKKTKGYKNLGNHWKEKDKSSKLELVNGVYIYSRDKQFDFGKDYYWTTGVANKKGEIEWTNFEPYVYKYPADNNPLKTIFWDATIKPVLPVKDVDIYVSVQVKKTTDVKIGGKTFNGTMVQYGLQGGFTTEKNQGVYGNFVTVPSSYVNYKVPYTTTEVRIVPFAGAVKVPLGGAPIYGDFKPALRNLTTVGVYKGIKIQTDIVLEKSKVQYGLRGKVETPTVAGYSVEAAGGARATFAVPQFLQAAYDALK